jgi:hypothetical protein
MMDRSYTSCKHVSCISQNTICAHHAPISDRGDDIITKIYNYSSVRKTSVPYKYRLSFNGKETELLPVEVGAITDGIQDARRALAKAVNAGVLKGNMGLTVKIKLDLIL